MNTRKQAERERIGQRIREIRKAANMEAKQLAEITSIDAANLSRIEAGKYSTGLDILCKIAEAMHYRLEFVPKGKD